MRFSKLTWYRASSSFGPVTLVMLTGTQIVNQTIDLCECFSKGLRVTCGISHCSLGVYFADSDAGVILKKPSRLLRLYVLIGNGDGFNFDSIFLRNVVFPKHVFSKQLSLCLKLEFPSIM